MLVNVVETKLWVGHRPAKNKPGQGETAGGNFHTCHSQVRVNCGLRSGHCFQLWELMQKWGSWVPLFWDNLGLFLKSAFWDMSDVASAEAIQTPCRSFASEATIVSLSSLQDICGWHPNYAAHSHAWVMTCSLVQMFLVCPKFGWKDSLHWSWLICSCML